MRLNGIGKLQDTILIGMLGGLIGTIVMEISNMLIYKAELEADDIQAHLHTIEEEIAQLKALIQDQKRDTSANNN